MGKGRLEAFTDGVIAVIITIMVLALYVAVAVAWFIPDRRIEMRAVAGTRTSDNP